VCDLDDALAYLASTNFLRTVPIMTIAIFKRELLHSTTVMKLQSSCGLSAI
jgi:hypothetical protein